ncbi:hypothetical protein FIV42_23875 [Persicimonas caeni]|uniref:Uncharacterized protein n=1 Tax=Persicimonas caeni TaxID=2292766 RepID=A0A4Y6PZC3_PERCE|nr:hypothetical protein [Persicimonas caeni]QDG53671.1 hypothetical protein FIV42_23875 [Persicimonas caeni]QED34892.1 hypothetical protein FRD00_23870 [Persicimonas caeni]
MKLRTVAAAALALALSVPSVAAAQVPAEVPVQAYLTYDSGVPVDGSVTVTFKIYDAQSGGAELHSETLDVSADAGAFTAYLTPDLVIFEDYQDLYLGLAVDGGSEMSPRLKMASVPYAAVAGNAATLEGKTSADFAPSGYQPDWADIQNVPADLSDGDDGATYAGTGAVQVNSNNEIGLITTCPDDNILKWDAGNSQWSCAADADEDTTYTAGAGVEIDANNAISLNSGCTSGQLLKWNGTSWACQADEDTTYLAGAGLQLTSNQFAVDYTAVQQRVTGTCGSGQYVMGVNQDGSVVCGTDQDTQNTYAAGSGLALNGGTFSVDTGTIQSRVSGTCASGDKIVGVNADGTVQCATDIDTDTDTTYNAGTGLALSGTTFSVANGGISDAQVASNAAIAPTKIDGTAATLTGDQSFGGNVSADNFNYNTAKSGRRFVSVHDFQFSRNPENTNTFISLAGYMYVQTGGSGTRVDLDARIELPQGATITEFNCLAVDNLDDTNLSPDDDLAWDFALRRLSIGGTTPTYRTVAISSEDDTVGSRTSFYDAPDTTIAYANVDNDAYTYYISGNFTPDTESSALRFYGCYVDYEVTSIQP